MEITSISPSDARYSDEQGIVILQSDDIDKLLEMLSANRRTKDVISYINTCMADTFDYADHFWGLECALNNVCKPSHIAGLNNETGVLDDPKCLQTGTTQDSAKPHFSPLFQQLFWEPHNLAT